MYSVNHEEELDITYADEYNTEECWDNYYHAIAEDIVDLYDGQD